MKIRDCPFCGGEPTLGSRKSYNDKKWYRVICLNSMCVICPSTAEFEDKEEAIKAWNRRKPLEDIVEQLEEQKIPNWSASKTEKILRRRNFEDAIEIVKGGA